MGFMAVQRYFTCFLVPHLTQKYPPPSEIPSLKSDKPDIRIPSILLQMNRDMVHVRTVATCLPMKSFERKSY